MTLEQRIEILEKEIADLKGQASERPERLINFQLNDSTTKSVKLNDSTTAYLITMQDGGQLLFMIGGFHSMSSKELNGLYQEALERIT